MTLTSANREGYYGGVFFPEVNSRAVSAVVI
jgi:hypothetical protein